MNKMLRGLTRNFPLKAAAVVIAFLIWLLVANTNNPIKTTTFSNVPITIVNQDSVADIGKVAEVEGTGTVTLRVTERRRVLDSLARNGSAFYVEADLENINEMDAVPLTVTCSNSAVTWDEITLNPASIKVHLEDKVEQTFVAAASTNGQTAAGCEVGSTQIVGGQSIYIAGPQSLVGIINQVVATVNVTGLKEDMTLSAPLRIYDKNGAELTESQMSSLELKDSSGAVIKERTVQVAVDIWNVRTDIPILVETVGMPAAGCRVAAVETTPRTISLVGTEEAFAALGDELKVIDTISVKDASENIEQEIDLTDTLSQYTGLRLIADASPVITTQVQIEKTGDIKFSVPIGQVDLQNRPSGRTLVFTPADEIPVTVRAADPDVGEIGPDEIMLSVDLSPCEEEGRHELDVEVKLPEGYELSSPVTIIVNSENTDQGDEAQTEKKK